MESSAHGIAGALSADDADARSGAARVSRRYGHLGVVEARA